MVALLMLMALVAACGPTPQRQVGVAARPTPTATATPVPVVPLPPAPTPEPAPPPEPTPVAVYPLTGEEALDPTRLAFPPLGVKVDNAAGALPQAGLNSADVVFEELVEGGLTRFLAIYHSTDPGTVLPVRSGREADADLFRPFNGVLAMSGAAGPTYGVLRNAGLTYFEIGQANGAIHRVPGRRGPHNVAVEAAGVWAVVPELPPATQPWGYSEAPAFAGTPLSSIAMAFSRDSSVSWAWRPAQGVWERGQNDGRHRVATGEQVSAATVLIARVAVGSGGGVDIRGSSTVTLALVGEGEATLLRDGMAYPARWRKASQEAPFEWLAIDGTPLPLAPGRTWVELLPTSGTLTFGPPTVSADAPEVALRATEGPAGGRSAPFAGGSRLGYPPPA